MKQEFKTSLIFEGGKKKYALTERLTNKPVAVFHNTGGTLSFDSVMKTFKTL